MKLWNLLGSILPASKDIAIVNRRGDTLLQGCVWDLFIRNRAERYGDRDVLAITEEKWKDIYYPASTMIIVLDEEEMSE